MVILRGASGNYTPKRKLIHRRGAGVNQDAIHTKKDGPPEEHKHSQRKEGGSDDHTAAVSQNKGQHARPTIGLNMLSARVLPADQPEQAIVGLSSLAVPDVMAMLAIRFTKFVSSSRRLALSTQRRESSRTESLKARKSHACGYRPASR